MSGLMTIEETIEYLCPFAHGNEVCGGTGCPNWRWRDPYTEWETTNHKWDIYPESKVFIALITLQLRKLRKMLQEEKRLTELRPDPPESDGLGEWEFEKEWKGNSWGLGSSSHKFASWKRKYPLSKRRGFCGVGGVVKIIR